MHILKLNYNGKIKSYNEDMAKTIINYQKKMVVNNQTYQPNISYFGVFDGHGGDKCSKFLKQSLDTILFNSPYFPGNIIESVKDAFQKAEQQFSQHAIKNGKLVCEIEFDYTDPGLKLFRNWQNGFAPKLNLNTIFVYDEKDPNLQNLKFLCLEFV